MHSVLHLHTQTKEVESFYEDISTSANKNSTHAIIEGDFHAILGEQQDKLEGNSDLINGVR